MEFIWVPAGVFYQGGNSGNGSSPMRKVRISPGFWLGKFEVTQAQWSRVMGSNPSMFKGAARPVEGISWSDANRYCKELTRRRSAVFRLPTEAEWEYACKLGAIAESGENVDSSELLAYNWVAENSGNSTHPVGTRKSDSFGFYDLGGNVYEWCLDTYRAYDDKARENPVVLPEKAVSDKVCRGGGYDCTVSLTLPDYRMYHGVNARISRVGMRVLMEAGKRGGHL
ncbi:MAG: SUMF1/EgtB/PvdO family nonheme iron enzyme [Candidatus Hydrogenedentes bacterium]|nr:SUMF1/EgtB/PvdO family nonheme iron enzyme [Candidatus Hydrogenedentota bacterium]